MSHCYHSEYSNSLQFSEIVNELDMPVPKQVIKGHPGNVFNVFPLLGFLGGRLEVQQVRVKRRPPEV